MDSLHVAIIMDGNGRWARDRGHARYFGHVRGAERVREVVREACSLGIGALTLYAFSTENWKRPEQERVILWRLLGRYLKREVPELKRRNVRLRVIGDRSRLDPALREAIFRAEEALASCDGLQLTLAISYGARDEIARAAMNFARDCLSSGRCPNTISEESFSGYLETSALKERADVDLLIRTGGEQRLSNFLLWQAAYAELLFVDKAWPAFSAVDLREAVGQFEGRIRRFGEVLPSTESVTASQGVLE